jgi:hypothetical protein
VLATLRKLRACHPGEAKRLRKGRSVIRASSPEPEDIPQFNDAASNAGTPAANADTLEAI